MYLHPLSAISALDEMELKLNLDFEFFGVCKALVGSYLSARQESIIKLFSTINGRLNDHLSFLREREYFMEILFACACDLDI
jgi:hypothetical protein